MSRGAVIKALVTRGAGVIRARQISTRPLKSSSNVSLACLEGAAAAVDAELLEERFKPFFRKLKNIFTSNLLCN